MDAGGAEGRDRDGQRSGAGELRATSGRGSGQGRGGQRSPGHLCEGQGNSRGQIPRSGRGQMQEPC